MNDEWLDIGNNHQVILSHLKPGSYTFMVKGCNYKKIWSNNKATLKLIITPPFWDTLLFKLSLALIIGFALYYIYKQRVKKIKKQMKKGTLFNIFCKKNNISVREKEVIQLILKGKSNRQIEDELFISISTVKTHIANIFHKFKIESRQQLIILINKELSE